MKYPDFYDHIEPLTLRDPLAKFLGATADGTVEVHYVDAVRLSGHSCFTVAGAWLMARCALQKLYGGETPVRGEIRVEMMEEIEAGVCGVVANVFSLITGAAAAGGFQGIGGKFSRRGLLSFGHETADSVHGNENVARFTRLDTGRTVAVGYDHSAVPGNPQMMPLMQKSLAGLASSAEEARFVELWTGRVRSILVDHGESLVTVRTGGI